MIDKTDWGDGPWQTEPDELAWSFGDVACRIVRHPRHGNLCGYVGIPPSHPWRGHDDICEPPLTGIEVHGGVTWSGEFGVGTDGTDGWGYTWATRTDNLWWVGFDCAHFQDLCPGMVALERSLGLSLSPPSSYVYRDIPYVRSEVESLARQAITAMREGDRWQRT